MCHLIFNSVIFLLHINNKSHSLKKLLNWKVYLVGFTDFQFCGPIVWVGFDDPHIFLVLLVTGFLFRFGHHLAPGAHHTRHARHVLKIKESHEYQVIYLVIIGKSSKVRRAKCFWDADKMVLLLQLASCKKTSFKGFLASKCDVGNWIFTKS